MPSPKMLLERKSQRRWYAILGLYKPYYMTPAGGGTPIGCQALVIMDVEFPNI
jgi:hypothetical protein